MSSAADYIALLVRVQINLYRFGGPILMGLGSLSCILSLIVFTKKNLRKNPCSVYLVAFHISNLLVIFTSILKSTLSIGYSIDPSLYNLIFCRCRFYALLVFDVLGPSYLILASIDRIFITSSNALTRQRSTIRFAFTCIVIITLFWLILHIHALILINFVQIAPGFILCYFQPGIHLILLNYYSILIQGIIVPLLMIISGLWAVKNVRSLARINPVSVAPASTAMANSNVRAGHSKDRQLLKILLIDIIVYVVFNLMLVIVLIYQQIGQSQSHDLVYAQMQSFLLNVANFSAYIPFCVGFYTNLWASKTFRNEVKNILMCR